MPDNTAKKRRNARSASISRDALDALKTLRGFTDDMQLAKAAKFSNTRIIERARSGKPIYLASIQRLAKALGVEKEVWKLKPTFGGDFDPAEFSQYVQNDVLIDRSQNHFEHLKKIADLVSEIQAKAAILQRLVVEALKPANSFILSISLDVNDSLRLQSAYSDGRLDDIGVRRVTVYPMQASASSNISSELSSQDPSVLAAQVSARLVSELSSELVTSLVARLTPQLPSKIAARLAARLAADIPMNAAAELAWSIALKVAPELAAQIAAEVASQLPGDLADSLATELASKLPEDVANEIAGALATEFAARFAAEISAHLVAELPAQVAARVASAVKSEMAAEIAARLAAEVVARIPIEVAARVAITLAIRRRGS